MIGQHDPAGANADGAGSLGHEAQGHSGGGARHPGHVVMFGHPEPAIAPLIGVGGEVAAVAERLAGVSALDDGRQV